MRFFRRLLLNRVFDQIAAKLGCTDHPAGKDGPGSEFRSGRGAGPVLSHKDGPGSGIRVLIVESSCGGRGENALQEVLSAAGAECVVKRFAKGTLTAEVFKRIVGASDAG